MKNVRKVRVFECVDWIGAYDDSPKVGQIYSEDYSWTGTSSLGEYCDLMQEPDFKLLGTIEVDCTPPTVKKSDLPKGCPTSRICEEEAPLPKKRRFKLVNGEGWPDFIEGKTYDEDYAPRNHDDTVLKYATNWCGHEIDWQEVFYEEENVPLPRYPDPVYLSYDEVERGKWYDVREALPDEGLDEVKLDGEFVWLKWDNVLGGFKGFYGESVFDDVERWRVI
jgi:hypothetical protein